MQSADGEKRNTNINTDLYGKAVVDAINVSGGPDSGGTSNTIHKNTKVKRLAKCVVGDRYLLEENG